MSTPSSTSGNGAPDRRAPLRDLRDSWLFRVLALVAVLAAALLATRSCASSGDVTADEAVAIALERVDFKPKCKQVRFLRQGIESIPTWLVSLWTLNRRGQFRRIAVVQVNAKTGKVIQVDHDARSPGTRPQCVSPV